MSVEFVLGKAKTGKSRYIYECISKDIQKDKKVILFVPSQARLIAEKSYMKELKLDGIINVNITTISVYVSDCLKEKNLHIEDKYISKIDRKILLTKVVNENSNIFKIFKKVKDKQGFLDMLNIYMDLFKKEGIDSNKILDISIKDKILETKLKEITYIYQKYLEALENEYIDNINEIEMFVEFLNNNKINLENTSIYFDGYNNFSNSELKLLQSLINKDTYITISLDTDITSKEDIYSNSSDDIFETSNKTYLKILKLVNKTNGSVFNKVLDTNYLKANNTLKYISKNIYNSNVEKVENVDNTVSLNLYSNVYSEISAVARKILDKIMSGYRFKDIAIYTTNIDSYYSVISRIFYEYKIPVYATNTLSIESSKLCLYILKLFEITLNNLRIENVLDILRLGLNSITNQEIYEIENYIKEFNMSKFSLKTEFKYNNQNKNDKIYDLDKLNTIRKDILAIFEDFQSKVKKENNSKNIVSYIYEHLVNNGVFDKYQEYISMQKDELYLINNSLVESQVWGKICEIFNSIDKIYNNEVINVKTFCEIFKVVASDMTLKIIPPTLDQVELLDINGSKTDVKKCVFFIGVNENSFPKAIDEDIFFSDFELEKLKSNDISFKETSISKVNMQLFNIYSSLNNVTKELNITVPATDFSGKSLRHSNLINLIKKCVNVKLVSDNNDKSLLLLDNIYSKEESFDKMVKYIRSTDDNISNKKNAISLYNYYLSKPRFKEIIKYVKKDDNLNNETIRTLYKENLKTTISKLELFKKCPFSYYMEYGLNIKPRKEYQITSMEIGSFMHSVVEEFSKYLLVNKIAWQETLDINEILQDKYVSLLNNIIENELDLNLSKHKESIKYSILKRKLINTMQKVITVIAKGFNQSEFVPYGYEIEFNDKGIFAPIEIKLDNGNYMKLVGKIDRIDVLKTQDATYARVVDYKSSSKTLDIDDIKEGLSLQLISYLTAFIENKKQNNDEIIPAAMLYFNLSDSLINLSEYTKDENQIQKEIIERLRMKGIFLNDIKVLEKMDHNINETSRIIDISKRSLVPNSKKALQKEQFESLCNEAKNILKNLGEEVLKGRVKIEPNKKADYCKYCNYSSVCRKESCV